MTENALAGKLRKLYATPLAEVHLPEAAEINARLKAIILEKAATEPNVTRSNVGGWHSATDLFDWPYEEIKLLKAAVMELVLQTTQEIVPELGDVRFKFALRAWANVSRRGDYHIVHNHPAFHWSGSYYVACDAPDSDTSPAGCIQFRDPRIAINMVPAPSDAFEQPVLIRPADGMMLLFPSWLEHFVHPHAGAEPRISIAYNCLLARA